MKNLINSLFIICFFVISCNKNENPVIPPEQTVRFILYTTSDGVIKRISEDGETMEELSDKAYNSDGPKCSPDGSLIAYFSSPIGGPEYPGIYLMKSDGSQQRRLTDVAGEGQYFPVELEWSKDNKTIFFTSPKVSNNFQTFSIHPDGTNEKQITNGDYATSPCPSPLLNQVAYNGSYNGNRNIYIQEFNSSTPIALLKSGIGGKPYWSPDGNYIAFSGNLDSIPDPAFSDVCISSIDGSLVVSLTSDHQSGMRDWSPDGKKILFASSRTGQPELYLMNSDGSNQIKLTSVNGELNSAHFSPDGKRIAFNVIVSVFPQVVELYAMDSDGTNLKKISDEVGIDFCWLFDEK